MAELRGVRSSLSLTVFMVSVDVKAALEEGRNEFLMPV